MIETGPAAGKARRFGGYRLVEALGTDDLGASYRARSPSGDRFSTIHLLEPRWATDAPFVARLARRAYAATLVDHPNLARVEGFGQQDGVAYVVGEFVAGRTIADLIASKAPIVPEHAAALVLQAARGLKHARDRGIGPRVPRPEDLRVEALDLVKVAGLGLADPPVAEGADERSLVESLGRILDALIGASNPRTVAIVAGDGLDAAIVVMEGLLGINAATGPSADESAIVAQAAVDYHDAPMAKTRRLALVGPLAGVALLAILTLLLGWPIVAGGLAGLAAMGALAYGVVHGLSQGSPLYARARALAFATNRGDRLTAAVGLLLVAIVAWALGLAGVTFLFAAAAVVAAIGVWQMIDRPLADQRRGPIDRVEELIRSWRRAGVEEFLLREWIMNSAGPRWELLYEALFGYDALRVARSRSGLAEGGRRLPRLASWRDPIVDRLVARLHDLRDVRVYEQLQRIEERGLVAQGINLLTARRRAHRAAAAMVAQSAAIRDLPTAPGAPAPSLRPILDAAIQPEDYLATIETGLIRDRDRPRRLPLDALLGPRARFLLGALLLAGCAAWVHQNRLIAEPAVRDLADQARVRAAAVDDLETARTSVEAVGRQAADAGLAILDASGSARPLRLPLVPAAITGLFRDFNPGVAGLLLIVSSFFRGWRMSLFAIPGAAVMVVGPVLIGPPIGPTTALVVGLAIAAAGLVRSMIRS